MFNTVTKAVPFSRAFSTGKPVFREPIAYASKLIRAGLPVPPKAPRTAYTMFVQDAFKDQSRFASRKTPEGRLDVVSISGELGQEWQNLPESTKDEYKSRANDDAKDYVKSFATYFASLQPGQLKAVESVMGRPLRFPAGRREFLRDLKEGSGEPEKGSTAFFHFFKAYRESEENRGKPVRDAASDAGAKWKTMSDAEKEPYVESSRKSRQPYKDWKAAQGQ